MKYLNKATRKLPVNAMSKQERKQAKEQRDNRKQSRGKLWCSL